MPEKYQSYNQPQDAPSIIILAFAIFSAACAFYVFLQTCKAKSAPLKLVCILNLSLTFSIVATFPIVYVNVEENFVCDIVGQSS